MKKQSTNVQNVVTYTRKMKKETTKSPKNKAIQKEDRWIDVHNDNVMREMGFMRPFNQTPRDKSVWQKTPNERRLLRNVKHSVRNRDMHFHTAPAKRATVRTKLIIHLKSNKVFPKSTYSQECLNTHISDALGRFQVTNPKTGNSKSIVAKYSYNGRTYALNEIPYCG